MINQKYTDLTYYVKQLGSIDLYWKSLPFRHGLHDSKREFIVGGDDDGFVPESGGSWHLFDDSYCTEQKPFNKMFSLNREAYTDVYGLAIECFIREYKEKSSEEFIALPFRHTQKTEKKSFVLEWMLDGAIALPQLAIASQMNPNCQFANNQLTDESTTTRQIIQSLYPRIGMRIGYHTNNEIGVIAFRKRLDNNNYYSVDCTYFCPDDLFANGKPNNEDELHTLYSRNPHGDSCFECGCFGRRIELMGTQAHG